MARLLIFRTDLSDADPVKDTQKLKSGDVISVREDNIPWGTEELALSHFRCVEVPGVPVSDLIYLMEPEPEDIDERIVPNLKMNKLNLAAIEARGAQDKGAALAFDDIVTLDKTFVLQQVSKNPSVNNPAYIGKPAKVIGK